MSHNQWSQRPCFSKCQSQPLNYRGSPDHRSCQQRLQNSRTALPIHLLLFVIPLLSKKIYLKHGVWPGCPTDCHFAHVHPTMRSILLVIITYYIQSSFTSTEGERGKLFVQWRIRYTQPEKEIVTYTHCAGAICTWLCTFSAFIY